MSLQQLRNCNFGSNRANATGSSGVGYVLLDIAGNVVTPRTTTGVYQLTSGSGIYSAYVTFPDDFHGQLLWDTGTAFVTASYAAEQVNVEENNPKVNDVYTTVNSMSTKVDSLYDIGYGRWEIKNNQMLFFRSDNITEVARFNLFDDAGNPTMDAVFQRVKV